MTGRRRRALGLAALAAVLGGAAFLLLRRSERRDPSETTDEGPLDAPKPATAPRALDAGGRGAEARAAGADAAMVPLAEGADRLAFDVEITTPGARRDGFHVVVEVVPRDADVVPLGEATTDAAGRCRVGPMPMPQVRRAWVPGAFVSRRVYGPYANPVGGAGPAVRARVDGRSELRVEDVTLLAIDFARDAKRPEWVMPPAKAADENGVRVVSLVLGATAEPRLRGRVVDGAGRPMPNARVRLPKAEHEWVAWTDAEGRFEGAVSSPGGTPVKVTFPWFDRDPPAALEREIEVLGGPAVTTVDFIVDSEPSIKGKVVSTDGRPLADVPLALVRHGKSVADARFSRSVSAWSDEAPYMIRVRSAADGTFRFSALPKDETFDVRWWDDAREERVGPAGLAPGAKGVVVTPEARHGLRVRCEDAETREPLATDFDVESISAPDGEESWRLTDPGERDSAFRAKPGERVRIVAQAPRYDPAVVEHVVREGDGVEDVVVRLRPSRSRARIRVRAVDEQGKPWPTMPALTWEFTGSEARAFPSPVAGVPTAGVFETTDLGLGSYGVRPAYDSVGLPASGDLRFATEARETVVVPASGEKSVDLVLVRGGALRIHLKDRNGKTLSPGDMTSLSVRDADGNSTELRIYSRTGRSGDDGPSWDQGVGGEVPHETQALPTGFYTVEWTGGLHRGAPVRATAAARVLAGAVTDVEIVLGG